MTESNADPARAPARLKAGELMRRLGDLQAKRATWEAHWQELADHVLPRRAEIVRQGSPGEKRMGKLYDATAIQANELLAAGLHGMLTSPATPWFELALPDAKLMGEAGVAAWLEESARRLHGALNASNFQTEMHELYLDLGCFGTAALFIEEDSDSLLRFSCRPLSEIYVGQDAQGRIDTVFRRFSFTARQAAQRWGGGSIVPRLARLAERDPDADSEILHAVLPRAARDTRRLEAEQMPFASVYIDSASRHVIAEGGFREMPFAVPRWSKAAGEVFGRSPAMTALPDIKMLNEMCRTTLRAAQKAVDPPLLIADDGVVLPLRTQPASLNFARFLADGSDPVRPLATNANVGLGLEMEERRRMAIRSAFYADQLQLAGGPSMTATEVLQRTEEKLRMLGPILGRLQSELLRPLIDRAFGIALRAGALPKPPAALAGQSLQVVYVSPIAKAQRQTEAQGLLKLLEFAQPLSAIEPELADNIDGDAALRHLWGLFSAPQSVLRAPRKVAERRAARQQAQAQTQALTQAQAQMGAQAGPLLQAVVGGARDA
jgi:hypothetical protein